MYLCVRVCVPMHSQMHRRGFRSPHVKILRMVFGFYLHRSLSEENACERIWGVGVANQRAGWSPQLWRSERWRCVTRPVPTCLTPHGATPLKSNAHRNCTSEESGKVLCPKYHPINSGFAKMMDISDFEVRCFLLRKTVKNVFEGVLHALALIYPLRL